MKTVFAIIFFVFLSHQISIAQQAQHCDLTNSHWAMKIKNCCTNYYDFKDHGTYVFYSGERDEYYPGVYSQKNDTIFFREFYSNEDDPYKLLDRESKFVGLVLNEDSFQLLYREDPIQTNNGKIKWLKTSLSKPSIFQRIK